MKIFLWGGTDPPTLNRLRQKHYGGRESSFGGRAAFARKLPLSRGRYSGLVGGQGKRQKGEEVKNYGDPFLVKAYTGPVPYVAKTAALKV